MNKLCRCGKFKDQRSKTCIDCYRKGKWKNLSKLNGSLKYQHRKKEKTISVWEKWLKFKEECRRLKINEKILFKFDNILLMERERCIDLIKPKFLRYEI